MMREVAPVVALGLGLGLDSFRAGIALGGARSGPSKRVAIASVFGASDALASVAGYAAGGTLSASAAGVAGVLAPLALGAYGIYVMVAARRLEMDGEGDAHAWAIWGIPVALSLDNLMAGVALVTLDFPVIPAAAMFGAMSATLAFAGLSLGGLLRAFPPRIADTLGAAALIGLAVVVAVGR